MVAVPAALQGLVVLGWPLDGVLQRSMAAQPRSMDVVELWAGVGSVAAAAKDLGFSVKTFDKFRIPGLTDLPGEGSEDMTTSNGFATALPLAQKILLAGLNKISPWMRLPIGRGSTFQSEVPHGGRLAKYIRTRT